jgi:hypothetical protein
MLRTTWRSAAKPDAFFMRQMYREIISLFFHKDVATRTEVEWREVEFWGLFLWMMVLVFVFSGIMEGI